MSTRHTEIPPDGLSAGQIWPALAAEQRSHVAIDIEPIGNLVKLTATHGGFEPGSTILPGVSEGWPTILASLMKSLLETGEELNFE